MSNPPPTHDILQALDLNMQLMKEQANQQSQLIQNTLPTKLRKKQKSLSKQTPPKQKSLPAILEGNFPESNGNYTKMLQDNSILISPSEMGFVPIGFWTNNTETFGGIVQNFFHKKNNSNCRFPHKLYNALQLVEKKPEFWPYVGVKWMGDTVFKVDKYVFGRLLGITAFDGGLFHSQGNFPSHGFQEITCEVATKWVSQDDLNGIDFDRIRLMTHRTGFKKGVEESVINQLKWISDQAK
ncbi:hypothetical protein GPJ56_006967 [Histomonas meleagridis]|uniref:uncharacterized protein n=1 Tax=Histomonas meleagridis TaxID=135588 RepID=UPI00355AC65A|nr:hypothetical protein GPJ56_006967 [Histomonas meleagridis]KAH0797773.1 hypothetical protein GO595_009402 [Histomonas meleagridis]